MTYTKIIDNIQTRIENIISERFAGTYQHITIEPSDYNPDIDDTITVTITVTDQNDDPITNWPVPLMINGVSVTDTLKTDSNGQVVYSYTCSGWGNCRFSVKSFVAFINVTGFKLVESLASNRITVYRDEKTMLVRVDGSWTNISSGTLATTTLKPKSTQVVSAHPSNSPDKVSFGTTGEIRLLASSTGSHSIYSSFYLPIA